MVNLSQQYLIFTSIDFEYNYVYKIKLKTIYLLPIPAILIPNMSPTSRFSNLVYVTLSGTRGSVHATVPDGAAESYGGYRSLRREPRAGAQLSRPGFRYPSHSREYCFATALICMRIMRISDAYDQEFIFCRCLIVLIILFWSLKIIFYDFNIHEWYSREKINKPLPCMDFIYIYI